MEGGYIFLYRKIREHWIWDNAEHFKWWIDLLMMANHQPKKIMLNGNPMIIDRGEHHTSETKLEKRWFASRKAIDNFFSLLEKDGMIELKKSRQTGTTIKVCNYRTYQPFFDNDSTSEEHQKNNDSTSKAHKQEPKEPKNLKKDREANASMSTDVDAPSSNAFESFSSLVNKIKDMFNDVCVSYPKCTVISKKRREAVQARLNTGYTIEDFERCFVKAEQSKYLKGKNSNNWRATFDWLIADANMAKVLDGNYDNNGENSSGSKQPADSSRIQNGTFDPSEFYEKAVKNGMKYERKES